MPSERDVVIKISRILLHDTFCIVNETDVSITQYLVKICYARSKKAGEKSERKTTFTRVCSHTQRLVICHAVELLVLRRDTKEQKLLRQVTHTHTLSYATRLKSNIQWERICPKLYTLGFSNYSGRLPHSVTTSPPKKGRRGHQYFFVKMGGGG